MAIPELKKNADLTSINCMSISHLSLFDEKQKKNTKVFFVKINMRTTNVRFLF